MTANDVCQLYVQIKQNEGLGPDTVQACCSRTWSSIRHVEQVKQCTLVSQESPGKVVQIADDNAVS